MSFDTIFANPKGRTGRGAFLGALVVLLAAVAFYYVLVKGRNGEWCLVTLLFPATILHVRRLHDMGRTALWLVLPVGLLLAVFAVQLKLLALSEQVAGVLPLVAYAVALAFIAWAAIAKGQAGPNRFGAAA